VTRRFVLPAPWPCLSRFFSLPFVSCFVFSACAVFWVARVVPARLHARLLEPRCRPTTRKARSAPPKPGDGRVALRKRRRERERERVWIAFVSPSGLGGVGGGGEEGGGGEARCMERQR
jgi:hypothetical protein